MKLRRGETIGEEIYELSVLRDNRFRPRRLPPVRRDTFGEPNEVTTGILDPVDSEIDLEG